jgi:hypothetical protein
MIKIVDVRMYANAAQAKSPPLPVRVKTGAAPLSLGKTKKTPQINTYQYS